MQYGKFTINLNDDMVSSVIRHGVTPAEAEVLRALHGYHSVTAIEITETRDTSTTQEMERLQKRFKSKKSRQVLNRIFPGSRPRLPINFSDIDIHNVPTKKSKNIEALKDTGMTEDQAKKVVEETNKKLSKEEREVEEGKQAAAEIDEKKKKPKKKKPKSKKKSKKKDDKFEDTIKIEYDEDKE